MIRLLGAVLVLAGAAAMGLSAAMRLRRRAALLGSLTGILSLMETEISFRLTPLPALLERAARQAGDELLAPALLACRNIVQAGSRESFANTWRTHVARSADLPLTEEERCVLDELGGVLGRCDAQRQILALETARARLEEYRTRAEEERGRQGRLFGTLGIACGAITVLVLI